MKILPRQKLDFGLSDLKLVIKAFSKNKFLDGKNIKIFEDEIKKYLGINNVVLFPSLRSSLFFVLKALGIKENDEIIIPAFTFHAVPSTIKLFGAKPVLVDIDTSYNLTPKNIERAITKKTKAIIVAHLFGNPCKIEKIKEVAKKHRLTLIEDCAHSFGSEVKGKKVGTFGDVALFSLGTGKAIDVFGGGMAISKNKTLINKLISETKRFEFPPQSHLINKIIKYLYVRTFSTKLLFALTTFPFIVFSNMLGRDAVHEMLEEKPKIHQHVPQSFKTRFTNIQAILALKRLKKIEEHNAIRINQADIYCKSFAKNKNVGLIKTERFSKNVYQYFPILVKKRNKIRKEMLLNKIDIKKDFMYDCSTIKLYSDRRFDCKFSEYISKHILYLPIGPGFTPDEISYVAQKLLLVLN